MCCRGFGKIIPLQEPALVNAAKKRQIAIVIINKNDSKESIKQCLELLKKECAQHDVELFSSSNAASDYIKGLDENTSVILVVAGKSHQNLEDEIPQNDSVRRKIRNFLAYSSEKANKEKPTTVSTQYIFGRRHLLSAVRDILDALNASPIHGHSDRYVSLTIHQSTFNELLENIKSIQFNAYKFSIKVSQMKVFISPSIIQFTALAEVSSTWKMFPRLIKQDIRGECELIYEEDKRKLTMKIQPLLIDFPKIFYFGGGPKDISEYIKPIPLDGFINFSHLVPLPDMCEVKQLDYIPRDPKIILEEQRATLSLRIDYAYK